MSLPELVANSPIPGADVPIAILQEAVDTAASGDVETWHFSNPAPVTLQAISGQFRGVIDSEIVLIDASSTNTNYWSVQRGQEGSTASVHSVGVSIYHRLTAGALNTRFAQLGTDGTVGGPGGSVLTGPLATGAQVAAGNLGATATVDFGSKTNREVTYVGTLTANCTLTLANRAAGAGAILLLSQDATGGRTLTLSDGATTQAVTINTVPNAVTAIRIDLPNNTDVYANVISPATLPSTVLLSSQFGVANGVAQLGTDSTVGGPGGSALSAAARRTISKSLLTASSVSVNPRPQQAFLMSDYDTGTTYSDADLQAAVNAAGAVAISNGYAELILDSRTVYNVANAPTVGANGQYAQIKLPFSSVPTNQPAQYLCIKGPAEAGALPSTHLNGTGHGPIIRSTYASVPVWSNSTGVASIIGGPAWAQFGGVGTVAGISGLALSLRGLTIRSAPTPVIAAVDASGIQGLDFDGLTIDTDAWGNGSSADASPNGMAIGMLMATEGSSAETKGGDAYVLGYRCAYMLTQQLVATRLQALNCYVAIALGPTRHANTIHNFGDWWNVVGVAGGYAPSLGTLWQWNANMAPVIIDTWDIETLTSTNQARVWDLWLPSNFCPQAFRANIIYARGGSGPPISPPPLLVKGQGTLNNFNGRVYDLAGAAGTRTPPTVPASNTALQNTFYRDCLVTISGGTVTAISINGVSTGQTSGVIVVPSGGYITLTYTVAPTWTWQAT